MEGKIAAHKVWARFGHSLVVHNSADHKASFASLRYRVALLSAEGAALALHSFEALDNSKTHKRVCRKFPSEREADFAGAGRFRSHKHAAAKTGFDIDSSTQKSGLDSWAAR